MWNSLPDYLREQDAGKETYGQYLKSVLFATYWCIRHIGGSMKISCMNLLCHCYYHRCSLVVQSGVAQHLTTSVTYLSAIKWATIVKCGPRWTNSTPDKISVLLICTHGKLLRWIRAHVFSRRWITTMQVTPTDQTCSWLPSTTISCWWWRYHLAEMWWQWKHSQNNTNVESDKQNVVL